MFLITMKAGKGLDVVFYSLKPRLCPQQVAALRGAKNFLRGQSIRPTTATQPILVRRPRFRDLSQTQYCPQRNRNFHTSRTHLKKGHVKKGADSKDEAFPDKATKPGEDPSDFTELTESLTKVHTKLKEGLSKLRAGGRFNPGVVDDLRVSLDKKSKDTVRLGDLAQCVPRGRILNVMVGEKDHVRAVSSAILGSTLNLNPQSDPQNPLQLNVQLPPPTTESREQVVKTAVDLSDKAKEAIRNARGDQQKRHKAMKTARPDDMRKASTKMEKIVADASAEVKKILDSAKRVLESG